VYQLLHLHRNACGKPPGIQDLLNARQLALENTFHKDEDEAHASTRGSKRKSYDNQAS
jgi:hypothetical protein